MTDKGLTFGEPDILDEVVASQQRWLAEHFPFARANIGWGTTETGVATKVYGHGILSSEYEGPGHVSHVFEPFGDAA